MSAAPALAGLATALVVAAAYELVAFYEELVRTRIRRRGGLPGGQRLAVKLACAAAALVVATRLLPLGSRVGLVVALALSGAAFLVPDAIRQRGQRLRSGSIRDELPDEIDLIAIEVGSGTAIAESLRRAAARAPGALGEELRRAVTEIETGVPAGLALAALGAGSRVEELRRLGGVLARALELGSPVDSDLSAQADLLRQTLAREARERAERAAPKIQLVVALVLVPAVLLIIAAAFVANAGALLQGF